MSRSKSAEAELALRTRAGARLVGTVGDDQFRVTLSPVRRRQKKAWSERSGRWAVWRLPWDVDVSQPFGFPRLPNTYRLVSVCLTLGPMGPGTYPGLRVLDGAGGIVADIGGHQGGAVADDQSWTWAQELPFDQRTSGTGLPSNTAPIPLLIISPSMSWSLSISAPLYNFPVRGVSVMLEHLDPQDTLLPDRA